ncbi:MAG: GntR family transcriptional regulator, partial [Anaerolineales bacterium]
MHRHNLRAGTAINMDATSQKLGISKTPLRDALIQLEMEGFVTIAPRKGIY